MSSSEEDNCELYDIPPVAITKVKSIVPPLPPDYVPDEVIPPVLMPKRSSGFNRTSALLDRQTPNATPVPAPRRLSSNRKYSDGFTNETTNKPHNEIMLNIKANFSKSLDLIETHSLSNEDLNVRQTGLSDSNIYKYSSNEQSWPLNASEASTDFDHIANSSTTKDTTITSHKTSTPAMRPVPKPRTRLKIISTQDLDSSVGLPLQTTQNNQIDKSSMKLELSSTTAETTQPNCSHLSEQNSKAVNLIQNEDDDVFINCKPILAQNKINYSPVSELISDVNHKYPSLNDESPTTLDDSFESSHYVSPDTIRNGFKFLPHNFESASKTLPSPKRHSSTDSFSYIQMSDKMQTQTSSGAHSPILYQNQQSTVQTSEQKLNVQEFNNFEQSTTNVISVPEDISRRLDSCSTHNYTIQKPFNDIQPFKSNVHYPSPKFDKEESGAKVFKNMNISETNFMWNGTSKPVQSPSKGEFKKTVESSMSNCDSDVLWGSVSKTGQSPSKDNLGKTVKSNLNNCDADALWGSSSKPGQSPSTENFGKTLRSNISNSNTDVLWNSASPTMQSPSRESFGKAVKSNINNPVSDVLWSSASPMMQSPSKENFGKTVKSNVSNSNSDVLWSSASPSMQSPSRESFGKAVKSNINNSVSDVKWSSASPTMQSPSKENFGKSVKSKVKNSDSDNVWSGTSKPVQSPSSLHQKPTRNASKDAFGKSAESNLNSPGSDFPVDWESAFASPTLATNTSSPLNSRLHILPEETNRPQAPLKPQNHQRPFVDEAPTSLPPPLPSHQNHSPHHQPPPLPSRPNNASNLYTQTVFQPSPIKKNTNSKASINKDIFYELPTPAFSHNQSSDPFQDSNFSNECYEFNANKVTLQLSNSPVLGSPAAKVKDLSSDMVDAKVKFDQNADHRRLNNTVVPPPISNEYCSSDSESTDPLSSISSDQGEDNGIHKTRLKVFDFSLVPKENSRSGYLFKQGGHKANKGWKKRWVVYNGSNLSYFSNNTAQVSKRIIPIRCMMNIETDVKATDKSSFKFKVITSLKDRIFVFASETLDDCLTWANTLMAAITLYRKSVKLSDQLPEKPDIEGFIKFGNVRKYYVTITGKILCYYQSYEDYQMGSPTHEIDMKLASVKVKEHKKLQLWIHYGHFNLTFESDQEMQQWRLAMEDAIAAGLADDTVLMKVYENINNQHCADCGVENPHWASVNLGIVICKNCAGIHRMFDYRLSKIRSLRMDTRVWTPSLIELMVTIGNANANSFWEFDLPTGVKIQPTESTDKRKEFIFRKYRNKQFCELHPLANQGPVLGEVLINAASHDNVLEMVKILFSGADVLYRKDGSGPTAYDVAKEHGQRLIMELLYQNGGDPQTSEQDVTDENRLREDVRLQGYLNKTGPVGRSFEKRWCILEHGTLTYYLSEKSKTFRGSIHRRDMYMIQATEHDSNHRVGYPFELSTRLKDNRIFTFSSDSKDDCGEWLRTIGRLMAPVAVMDQVGMIDVKLAGYAFMKESLGDEWHQTFLVFSWRGIHYINRDLKFDYLDLRKASGIKMQDSSNSYQQRGPSFVISSTGKSVYLQATLTRDTEKMYSAFLEAIVSSGTTLIDQALTNENVPVIVEKCITHVYMNGLEEKGIYRVAGQNSRVQALLDDFRKDVWSVSMNSYTVQDVSNVLKRFLRELDDSVFGRIKYVSWINKAGCKDANNRLMWYKYYLEKMPQVNYQTLKRIILHLVEVSEHESINLMSIGNLASCFAPSLMRTAKDDPNLATDAAGKEISIIVDLLNNSDYFFNVNDDERIILNNIRWAEKEIQKRIQENRISVVDPATAGILIPVHLLGREGQSVNVLVTEDKTAKEAMEYLKRNKTAPDLGTYVLYEQLFKGVLERPLFPEDIISKTTNRWMEWESWVMENNNVCLCVQGLDLLEKLNTHFSPNQALLSKHQYCDSKPKSRFKRRVIGFRQCKLALYGDSQGNSELISWKVEDITIYLGSVPRRTLPPYRYCLTFIVNEEKYTKPSFGHCISFETENELCRWAAALYAAQHPTGLLSWVL